MTLLYSLTLVRPMLLQCKYSSLPMNSIRLSEGKASNGSMTLGILHEQQPSKIYKRNVVFFVSGAGVVGFTVFLVPSLKKNVKSE